MSWKSEKKNYFILYEMSAYNISIYMIYVCTRKQTYLAGCLGHTRVSICWLQFTCYLKPIAIRTYSIDFNVRLHHIEYSLLQNNKCSANYVLFVHIINICDLCVLCILYNMYGGEPKLHLNMLDGTYRKPQFEIKWNIYHIYSFRTIWCRSNS